MVVDSYRADYLPNPKHIMKFVDEVEKLANLAEDEVEWFERVQETALDWLAVV